jgi:aspartyl/asparaginyl-tRNA synthetase
MSALSEIERAENQIEHLIERLDKTKRQMEFLLENAQLAFDIMEVEFSRYRYEKAAEILEDALASWEAVD